MEKEGPDKYAVDGFLVMVTSKEVVSGGEAARIPVRIVVEKTQGRWMITEYGES
ncbi:MAG TPA: hypothetical protein VNO14_01910 [Blastocatellia bacterium]|nr:hypothetical protein [Blastocatellia bacterium]